MSPSSSMPASCRRPILGFQEANKPRLQRSFLPAVVVVVVVLALTLLAAAVVEAAPGSNALHSAANTAKSAAACMDECSGVAAAASHNDEVSFASPLDSSPYIERDVEVDCCFKFRVCC